MLARAQTNRTRLDCAFCREADDVIHHSGLSFSPIVSAFARFVSISISLSTSLNPHALTPTLIRDCTAHSKHSNELLLAVGLRNFTVRLRGFIIWQFVSAFEFCWQ